MRTATTTHSHYLAEASTHNPSYQAYQILHWGFVVAPVLAGLDKFFMKLTDWTMYLWPPLAKLAGGATNFMRIAGVIEVAAGCLVGFKPKLGAPIVAAWLIGIIGNLILLGGYYDVALRDLGLCLGACALWRLSLLFDHTPAAEPVNQPVA